MQVQWKGLKPQQRNIIIALCALLICSLSLHCMHIQHSAAHIINSLHRMHA
jgi:hypothetical protein